ncbi:MAG: GNAT family N-acetyltransferase [Oscillospiraceae bacterium]|nr:GNAT family N-acetyltransferase [Oscillospiraceae bacterium]MBQ2140536.1 GNAT family N-acetyltransferase [Acidaminococcaceae bacterium]MBR4193709.1 GNAT family N-acetyltransferase [Oscillospiraceae bacterium]
MRIQMLDDRQEKQRVARVILEALPEWFGIPEARENYIRESADEIMLVSSEGGEPDGFLCLKETGRDTLELAVMGVLKEYHRQGVGTALVQAAKRIARERGYSFLQVKTVQMGRYPEYDATNRFYLSLGFKEFEVFPTLWDEWNPCQIYVMSVDDSE